MGFHAPKSGLDAGVVFLDVGLGSVLSFNLWKNVHFLQDKTFFGTMDFLTSNVMLPLGGMFTALFVGWVWTQQQRDGESGMPPEWSNLYGVLVKFVAPVLVFVVFVESVT